MGKCSRFGLICLTSGAHVTVPLGRTILRSSHSAATCRSPPQSSSNVRAACWAAESPPRHAARLGPAPCSSLSRAAPRCLPDRSCSSSTALAGCRRSSNGDEVEPKEPRPEDPVDLDPGHRRNCGRRCRPDAGQRCAEDPSGGRASRCCRCVGLQRASPEGRRVEQEVENFAPFGAGDASISGPPCSISISKRLGAMEFFFCFP